MWNQSTKASQNTAQLRKDNATSPLQVSIIPMQKVSQKLNIYLYSDPRHKQTFLLPTLLVLTLQNACLCRRPAPESCLHLSNLSSHLERLLSPACKKDFFGLLPQQSLYHPLVIWEKFQRIAPIPLHNVQLLSYVSHLYIHETFHYLFSVAQAVSAKKEKITIRLHLYFKHFHLKLRYNSNIFAYIPQTLFRE